MREWLVIICVLISTFFMLLAAIGVVQMPDVFTRLSVTTKGATLGAGLVLLAVAIFFNDVPIATRAMLGIAFLMLTQPIAAHMIGRAAYIGRVPLWSGTVMDDLRDPAALRTHTGEEFSSTREILEALAAAETAQARAVTEADAIEGADPPTTTPETRN
jgi:multicomponent Na+:H+ antiporter subunit G